MKKLIPEDPQTHSADVVADNVERLRGLLPEAFTEGRVDFDVLKQLLSGVLEEHDEKYGLSWHGKRRARQLALTPSTGTLRPCPEESVDWDTTQNLMIEGDNLEVLKLLQKSYAGKVKLIYIDPPYNTGKDFVYPDDFRDNIQNYLELTGQADAENGKVSSNTETSGRFHTDWLNMIYPRLLLARQLLRDDGLIVMSVDDAELQRLRELSDSVFGEENYLATLVWDRNRQRTTRATSPSGMSTCSSTLEMRGGCPPTRSCFVAPRRVLTRFESCSPEAARSTPTIGPPSARTSWSSTPPSQRMIPGAP